MLCKDPALKLKNPRDVRWLSHEAAVDTILRTLPSLLLAFEEDSKSPIRESRALAIGLTKITRSYSFIASLCLFADVLPIVNRVSKAFQSRDVDLASVNPIVTTAIAEISAMLDTPGPYMKDLEHRIYDLNHQHGIEIARPVRLTTSFDQVRRQFVASVRDNMTARFPKNDVLEALATIFDQRRYPAQSVFDPLSYGVSAMKTIMAHFVAQEPNGEQKQADDPDHAVEDGAFVDDVNDLDVLDQLNELKNVDITEDSDGELSESSDDEGDRAEDLLVEDMEDGDAKINWLPDAPKFTASLEKERAVWCALVRSMVADPPRAKGLDMVETISKMLSFDHVSRVYPELCRLAEIVLVIPVVTVECERGFSSMNRIKTKARNRLTKLLSKLMRISMQTRERNFPTMQQDWLKLAMQVWMSAGVRKCSFPGAL